MSFEWEEAVWSLPKLKIADRVLLLCGANYANTQGHFWPSIATMERRTGLDRARIQRQLRRFEQNGWIKRVTPRKAIYGRGKTTDYVFMIPLVTTKGRSSTANTLELSTESAQTAVAVRPLAVDNFAALQERAVSLPQKGRISRAAVCCKVLSTDNISTAKLSTAPKAELPSALRTVPPTTRSYKDILAGPPPIGLQVQ